MATQLNTTELDFTKIKENLKNYLKNSDSTFSDYDFEGSGLNHLLDILAYNTHYNAINAHMAVNESFIDTAQIRSNVVSHAKLVGYTPRSSSSATATLAIKLQRTGGTDSSATLPSGTSFTTSVGGKDFIFQTLADVISNRYNSETNNFEFDNVEVYEGSLKTTKFFFNDINNEKFIITDSNVDTSTLKVTVKDSTTSLSSKVYTLYKTESNIGAASEVYYLSENYDGLYQIEFGNSIFGKKPIGGSVIECTYLTSSLEEPNGATTFTLSSSLPSNTSLADSDSITTVNNATGGADRESIESIQFNAPRSFIAQNRAVTTDDFEVAVRESISDISDVIVYGGQDVNPPQYGKVFISVKPKSGLYLSVAQKNEVLRYLNAKKIVTITPEIVDADYTFIYFNITSKYNSNLTSKTKAQIESSLRDSTLSFNETFLQNYGNNFRYSKFLKALDDSDSSINGSIGQVYTYKRISIKRNDTAGQLINFGFKLLGDVNQGGSFITTTGWTFNNKTYFFDDIPISGDNEKRSIRRYYMTESNLKVVEDSNVGYLYPETGLIKLNSQQTDTDSYVDITVIPATYDIPGIENKLLNIDITKTILVADNNISSASVGIVPENYVSTSAASGTGSSFNPLASGVYVPHTMYDPTTGIGYYAGTYDLHLEYSARGYVHYIPSNVTSGSLITGATPISVTTTNPVVYGSSSSGTGTSTSGTGQSGSGTSNPTPPPYGY